MQSSIGIFDSGIGGLAVWQALKTHLPQEQLVYYADTAYMPFGNKSVKLIKERSRIAVQYFLSQKAKLIIFACNTASAVALQEAQKIAGNIPVLGVIEPSVNWLSQLQKLEKPILIATARTIESGVFVGSLAQKGLNVKALATPALADFIEAEFHTGSLKPQTLVEHLQPALTLGASHIILGCTHYALAAQEIQTAIGLKTIALDPAPAIAQEALSLLLERKNIHTREQVFNDIFIETGTLTGFQATVNRVKNKILKKT